MVGTSLWERGMVQGGRLVKQREETRDPMHALVRRHIRDHGESRVIAERWPRRFACFRRAPCATTCTGCGTHGRSRSPRSGQS
jgi:hypothetical protein